MEDNNSKEEKEKKRKNVIVSLVVLFFLGAFVFTLNTGDDNKTSTKSVSTKQTDITNNLEYKILEQSVYAPNGEKFLIMLPKGSTKEYVQQVAEDILKQYTGDADELSWLFWDDQRAYDSDLSVNVGTAQWSGGDIVYKLSDKKNSNSGDEFTNQELEIYDYYWALFSEEGNPRGYINHPLRADEGFVNDWEMKRLNMVTSKYNISQEKLFNIVANYIYSQAQ